MQLLGTDTSPYTRKVRLVILERRLLVQYVVTHPRDAGSPVPRSNPLGRVPTLLLDDGTPIFDSPVICEYLDGLRDAAPLLPRDDAAARLLVKRWEAIADGIMDSAVAVRIESLRPAEKQDPAWLALHARAIDRALAFASTELADRSWCVGQGVTLADLALVSALLYLDLRQPERDWRGGHPTLAAFAARMAMRQSVRATR